MSAQSCPTLCNPMDCSPPGSSVHEISQARILEWATVSSSRGLPNPGIEPAKVGRRVLYHLSQTGPRRCWREGGTWGAAGTRGWREGEMWGAGTRGLARRSAGLRGTLLRGPLWFEVPLLRLFTPLFPEAENPEKVLVGQVGSE